MSTPGRVRRTARFLHTHPTGGWGWNWLIWTAALLIVIGVAATSGAGKPRAASSSAQRGTAAPTSASTKPPTPTGRASSTTSAGAGRHAPRPTPTPADTTGSDVVTAAGVVLPDRLRTPGAVNPEVTQADIDTTICVAGWTATIRPPSSYTTDLKERQLATGYAYRDDLSTGDYEEDHLISLELGGSPRSELNLWPEPYRATDGARTKDQVENRLHQMVCSGSITLAKAQHAIAANWFTAYELYVGSAPLPNPTTSVRTFRPATSSVPAPPASPLSCTANVSNAQPAQYSTVDVIVKTGVPGAGVSATAHYKSKDTTNTGVAAGNGVAEIPFRISRATAGYQVNVDVTVTANGATRSCVTAFTPQ